ncbi:hypothetical protein [Endozoicomonas ascidiicola]|uniref:hypothetical protein n=1 Tax=Endozoicomonas ascidiicola TaxID=1698521 RepID=UPI000AD2C0E9
MLTLGVAKENPNRAAHAIDDNIKVIDVSGNIAVMKSVVTQTSSAIPVMPF